MNKFLTVLKFEFMTTVKNKTFKTTSIVIILLIALATLIPTITGIFSGLGAETPTDETKKAVFFDTKNMYDKENLNNYIPAYSWEEVSTEKEIEEFLANEEYVVGLKLDEYNFKVLNNSSDMMNMISEKSIKDMMIDTLQLGILKENDVSDNIILDMNNVSEKIKGEYISLGKDIRNSFWIGYVLLFLLYFSLIIYGQLILTSVATEKSTKTMEVLITSVEPKYLVFGKVVGTGLAALLQFSVFILTAIGGLLLNKGAWQKFSPGIFEIINTGLNFKILILAILFFIIAFFVYSFVYAALGSLVSRMEDVSSMASIPTLLVVLPFLISVMNMYNPDTALVKTLSFIPFLSPYIMFMRICVSDVPTISIIISIIINLLTIVVSGAVSAKIYKVGVLMYGNTPKVKDVFKIIFSK